MRCFFMRRSSILNVAFVADRTDEEAIDEALAAFQKQGQKAYDGFEVWQGRRFVYCYTEATKSGERVSAD